jgi:hypothetical protein
MQRVLLLLAAVRVRLTWDLSAEPDKRNPLLNLYRIPLHKELAVGDLA